MKEIFGVVRVEDGYAESIEKALARESFSSSGEKKAKRKGIFSDEELLQPDFQRPGIGLFDTRSSPGLFRPEPSFSRLLKCPTKNSKLELLQANITEQDENRDGNLLDQGKIEPNSPPRLSKLFMSPGK